jgi:hypothetical protein
MAAVPDGLKEPQSQEPEPTLADFRQLGWDTCMSHTNGTWVGPRPRLSHALLPPGEQTAFRGSDPLTTRSTLDFKPRSPGSQASTASGGLRGEWFPSVCLSEEVAR